MTVLIYYPFNLHADSLVCQVRILRDLGHEVIFLSSSPTGPLHAALNAIGVKTFAPPAGRQRSGLGFFYAEARLVRSVAVATRADCILAHLQGNAMIAGLAFRFSRKPVIYMRHNSDYYQLRNSRKELFINRLANRWSNRILAISRKVSEQLLKEGVEKERIARVNLAYDFRNLPVVRPDDIKRIQSRYTGQFRLLIAARLDPLKRHILAFEVIRNLRTAGLDAILVCIGEGEERQALEGWIRQNRLDNAIFLPGHIIDVDPYYAASDVLVHLSVSEASSHVVKEAALRGCTALVCENVGDFDDYMVDNVNAILVPKDHPVAEATRRLKEILPHPSKRRTMSEALCRTIIDHFDMEAVTLQYAAIFKPQQPVA